MKDRITNIAGAVLAGGKCRRMGGTDKAFISIEGFPIILRTVNLLKEIFEEVIIISNTPEKYNGYMNDIVVVPDVIPDIGPFGGIFTVLSTTEKEAAFVTACDMPFLEKSFIQNEAIFFNRYGPDILIPRTGSQMQPLCAIYDKKLKERMNSYISMSSNRSIQSFMQSVDTHVWELENNRFHRKLFININTREDMRGIQGMLQPAEI